MCGCCQPALDLVEGSLVLSQLHAPGREQRPGTNDGGGLPDSLPGAFPHLCIVIANYCLKGFTFKYQSQNYQTTHRPACKYLFIVLDFCQASPQAVFVCLEHTIGEGVLHVPVRHGLHVHVEDRDHLIPAALVGMEKSIATGRGRT